MRLLFIAGNKFSNRPVVGLLSLTWEETTGELLERPVVIDALAAFPHTGTGFVGAGAEVEVLMKAADNFLFLNHGVSP